MPEEYAYHRLEHIAKKSYRYEFMLPYFPTKSHIFTACFEPHEAVIGNGGLERIVKLLKWLPPDYSCGSTSIGTLYRRGNGEI